MSSVEAFRKYNFDNDERWRSYLRNIEIPAGTNQETALLKVKAKWYQKNVDQSLDVAAAVTSSSRSEPPPATASGTQSSSSRSTFTSTPPPPPTSSSSSVPPAPSGGGWFSSLLERGAGRIQWYLFVAHVALVILGAVQLIPFTTLWGVRCYRIFCQVSAASHLTKVVQRYGLPSFRPWSALGAWAQRALPSADFHYAMMALVFLPHPPRSLVVVPSATLAAYHVLAFAREHFSHTSLWRNRGEKLQQYMLAHQSQALLLMASAEIALGFILIVELITPSRNFLLVFFMWNMLKMRYHAPDSAGPHRQVWSLIEQRAAPFIARVPALQMLLGYAQRWFLSVR